MTNKTSKTKTGEATNRDRGRAAVDWSPEYAVHVREDLYETDRYDEDGERIVRSRFYLVATGRRGHRWNSPHVHREFASAKSERDRKSVV